MREFKLWKFIASELQTGKRISLMIVAASNRSSPGRAGFKMAVTENTKCYGTIGGGIMERNLIKKAPDLIIGNKKIIIKKLYHNPNSSFETSGLICGGNQTIIIINLAKSDLTIVKKIIDGFNKGEKATLCITPLGLKYASEVYDKRSINFNYNTENDWEYCESYGMPDTIYIIGGGHVGLAVAHAMSTLDFRIFTFDPRKDVFTVKQNIYSNKIFNIPYEKVGEFIEEGNRSYVVILTSEMNTDIIALKSIIKKNVGYIGLMGSKVKIKKIFNSLTQEEFDPKLFDKISAPIGIEIYAETPEEIAVSIAAEIIKTKYNDSKKSFTALDRKTPLRAG